MHQIPSLKYKYSDLEPYLDEQTMRIHHTKHHQAYVDKLNAALEAYPELASKDLTSLMSDLAAIPEAIRQTVINNGGGHLNHSLFWEFLTPAGETPKEKTLTALDQAFGGLEVFKKQFKEARLSRFGSGWVWLIKEAGSLKIITTANQDSPISEGKKIVFGIDVWEHAYYLKYQNRRADYLEAVWNVVNWSQIDQNIAL